jgi:hypothetical protein
MVGIGSPNREELIVQEFYLVTNLLETHSRKIAVSKGNLPTWKISVSGQLISISQLSAAYK